MPKYITGARGYRRALTRLVGVADVGARLAALSGDAMLCAQKCVHIRGLDPDAAAFAKCKVGLE